MLIASISSGCIPSADAPDLDTEVPKHFVNSPQHAENHYISASWWTAFQSPELNRFMTAVEEGNLDIKAAAARIVQADATARLTGAALLPNLSASDSVTRSRSSALAGAGISTTIYQAGFNASYIVDFWGKNRAALQATEESAMFSRFDQQTIGLTALANTATTYLAVLGARERINYVNQNLKASTRILELIKSRLTFGTANSLDVAQQQALVDNLWASIPPLQQIADQNLAALSILIGRAPERIAISARNLAALSHPVLTPGLPSELLARRPDVQGAEAQLAAAHANLVSARAAFFPQIQLTGSGGFQSLALQSLFSPSAGFYSFAAGLTQPIFDGGVIEATFQQDKGRQDELLADYRKAIISAFNDVEQALIALRETSKQEKLLQQSLKASQTAFDLSEAKLREGTLDYVTLLQTQQTLFTTQDNLSQVRLARLQASVTLFQALGGGWQDKIATASLIDPT